MINVDTVYCLWEKNFFKVRSLVQMFISLDSFGSTQYKLRMRPTRVKQAFRIVTIYDSPAVLRTITQ